MKIIDKLTPRQRYLVDLWWKDPSIFYEDLYSEKPYPYQVELFRNIKEQDRILIVAAGGVGKSKGLSGIAIFLGIVYACKVDYPYDVIIMAGSKDQSRKLYEYSSELLPNHDIFGGFVTGEVLKTVVKLTTGSMIKPKAHSLGSIQGEHGNCVIIDEAAYVDDFFIKDAYRIIGGKPNAKLIFSGTPATYESMFVDMWEQEKQYSEWERYTWSASDCPSFSQEMIDEARRTMDNEQFTIYWLGTPHPITNRVVPVELIRKASIGVEVFPYNPKYKSGLITMGVDWGFTDLSVAVISQLIDDRYRILHIQTWHRQDYDLVHDAVKGLAEEYRVDNAYVDLNPKGESLRCVSLLGQVGVPCKAIDMRAELGRLQIRMKTQFEKKTVDIPAEYIKLLDEIRRYRWDQRKGEDRVVAFMLSLRGEGRSNEDIYYVITNPSRRGWSLQPTI